MPLPFPFAMVGRGSSGGSALTYIGSTSQTANQSSYTFSGASIGDANANRMVVIVANGGTAGVNLSDITIDGNSASVPISAAGSALGYLAFPSGSTADIVVSFSGTQSNCSIMVYRGITANPTPDDTDIATVIGGTQSGAITGTIASGGFAVVYSFIDSTTDQSCTWTGATENDELFPEASTESNISVASITASGAFSVSAAWGAGNGSTRIAFWDP